MTAQLTARVLVVEDAEPIRTAVGIALTEGGHTVLTRPDGEGLERDLAEYRPDLVLLDVMLPGRDGFELLTVTRETSNAGVILLTARDAVDDRLHGLRTGADDYVVKPFVLAELIARVEAVLRRMGRLRTVLEVGVSRWMSGRARYAGAGPRSS
jgi:two-component system OmpR family response regulator